ncbi:MAG: DUF4827 family protein [Paludibacteraceae bacterium]
MKFKLFAIALMTLTVLFSACSNKKTYSELQDEEQALITNYLKKNNIKVVTILPDSDKWTPDVYYKSTSGLYFHLVSLGDTAQSIKSKSKILYRYAEYTLKGDTVVNTYNPQEYRYPHRLTFEDYTTGTTGLQEAVSLMKFQDSEAKIIIPHNLNSSSYLQSVTPMAYDVKIKIVP